MNPNSIAVALTALAQGLGVDVNQVYKVLIKQARLDGFYCLLWVAAGVCLIYFFTKQIKNLLVGDLSDISENELCFFFIYVVVIIIGVILVFANFSDAFNGLFNPDWQVIKKIIWQLNIKNE